MKKILFVLFLVSLISWESKYSFSQEMFLSSEVTDNGDPINAGNYFWTDGPVWILIKLDRPIGLNRVWVYIDKVMETGAEKLYDHYELDISNPESNWITFGYVFLEKGDYSIVLEDDSGNWIVKYVKPWPGFVHISESKY